MTNCIIGHLGRKMQEYFIKSGTIKKVGKQNISKIRSDFSVAGNLYPVLMGNGYQEIFTQKGLLQILKLKMKLLKTYSKDILLLNLILSKDIYTNFLLGVKTI